MMTRKPWAPPVVTEVVLEVSEDWVRACGYGTTARRFPVLSDIYCRRGRTFIEVELPEHAGKNYSPWCVAPWLRDAKFIPVEN